MALRHIFSLILLCMIGTQGWALEGVSAPTCVNEAIAVCSSSSGQVTCPFVGPKHPPAGSNRLPVCPEGTTAACIANTEGTGGQPICQYTAAPPTCATGKHIQPGHCMTGQPAPICLARFNKPAQCAQGIPACSGLKAMCVAE